MAYAEGQAEIKNFIIENKEAQNIPTALKKLN